MRGFVAGTGIEPVFAPWKGAVLTDRRTGQLYDLLGQLGRKNRIHRLYCQTILAFFQWFLKLNLSQGMASAKVCVEKSDQLFVEILVNIELFAIF